MFSLAYYLHLTLTSWCRFPIILGSWRLSLSGASLRPSLGPIDWHRVGERVREV